MVVVVKDTFDETAPKEGSPATLILTNQLQKKATHTPSQTRALERSWLQESRMGRQDGWWTLEHLVT
jgi:hypothetical protein